MAKKKKKRITKATLEQRAFSREAAERMKRVLDRIRAEEAASEAKAQAAQQ